MKKILFGTLILLGASTLANAQEKKDDKTVKAELRAEEQKKQELKKQEELKLKAEREAEKTEQVKQEQIKKEEAEIKAKEQSTPVVNSSVDAAVAPEKAEVKSEEPVKETGITQRKPAAPRQQAAPGTPKAKAKPAKKKG